MTKPIFDSRSMTDWLDGHQLAYQLSQTEGKLRFTLPHDYQVGWWCRRFGTDVAPYIIHAHPEELGWWVVVDLPRYQIT